MMALVSRRAALATGLAATVGVLGGSAAPVPKGDSKSWVGKTVLPKKADPIATYYEPVQPGKDDFQALPRALYAASWEVKAEKDERIQVLDTDGTQCWIEKSRVVPLADAVDFFTKAIQDNEKDVYPYNFRGWAKYLLGKPDDAVKDFDEFLKLAPVGPGPGPNPYHAVGFSNRGLVLAELGRFDAAIKDLNEAVKLGHAPAQLNRGWAYELKGEYKKAIADYEVLLRLGPDLPQVLNNFAWLKATCPDATFRDGKRAVELAKRACELTGNREGEYLDTLAAAHAESDDFTAAVKAQKLALEDNGYAKRYGEDAQKRLKLYQDRKPYRTEPLKPQ
ncbi:Tetratricopeptide repeat protein [Gemmata sp. SH-PL17]|uniref:tetratricopeptide repeat protein n=1 Tax=Gemmata sp. SH-PL17 TaxID=1630693 RepID=UPI00078DC561|nr:tetratricopeptide repeat protein [Gemmata sp. SH-PL17]AMV23224.1 Tetratricopeptide repeat protein [Gemmata sp. SH-PL17]